MKYILILLFTLSSATTFAAEKTTKDALPLGQDRGGAPIENLKGTVNGAPLNVNPDKLLPFYSIFKTHGKAKIKCGATVDSDLKIASVGGMDASGVIIFECIKGSPMCTVTVEDPKRPETDPKKKKGLKTIKQILEVIITAGTDMYTSVNRTTALEKAAKTKEGWETNYSSKMGTIFINTDMTEMNTPKKKMTAKLTVIDGYLFATNISGQRDDKMMNISTDYVKKGEMYFPSRIKSHMEGDIGKADHDIKIENCKVD